MCFSKIAVRKFTEIIISSRAILFLTESIANSYESAIAGQERILIGQVDETRNKLLNGSEKKLLELKLLTENF